MQQWEGMEVDNSALKETVEELLAENLKEKCYMAETWEVYTKTLQAEQELKAARAWIRKKKQV